MREGGVRRESDARCVADDHPDGAGGVVAAGVVVDAAHAGRAAARAAALAGGGAGPAHSVRPARAPLGALGLRLRAPGGLRAAHHVRQDHAAHPARGRGAVGAGVAAGQVPRAPAVAGRAARAHAEPRHRRLMRRAPPRPRTVITSLELNFVLSYYCLY